MSAHYAAPGAEGSSKRFIVKCALTFGVVGVRPSFIYPREHRNRERHISAEHPLQPPGRKGSAVFRCLGDYVTHPGVLGLDFSMRNAIRRCSVAMHAPKPDLRAARNGVKLRLMATHKSPM